MNLIKEYLGSVAGADTFAIISMLIFLFMFIFLLFQIYSIRKDNIREYSRLPLDEDDDRKNKD